MSEAHLIFQLPDDETEFRKACRATDLARALWDTDQMLRDRSKYEEDVQKAAIAEEIRKEFKEILEGNYIYLDSLLKD